MLSQTPAQNKEANVKIEELLNGQLKSTVKHFISKYGKTFERRLGYTRDDMMNDMREQIWKGLLTHKPESGANIKTYLNTLIRNRVLVLLKRSKIKKHSSVDYYSDVFASVSVDDEHKMTEENGETLLQKRQDFMLTELEHSVLTTEEQGVYAELLLGRGIDEIMKTKGLQRVVVTAAILRIDVLING
jgi:DNA-directed RNA polymerase specialized sigma24 family protein